MSLLERLRGVAEFARAALGDEVCDEVGDAVKAAARCKVAEFAETPLGSALVREIRENPGSHPEEKLVGALRRVVQDGIRNELEKP